jgi:hypothetical protein
METLDKINKYLFLQEKKESIYQSQNVDKIILDEAIEIYRKSDNKEKTLNMFNEDIKKQLKTLIEGSII